MLGGLLTIEQALEEGETQTSLCWWEQDRCLESVGCTKACRAYEQRQFQERAGLINTLQLGED